MKFVSEKLRISARRGAEEQAEEKAAEEVKKLQPVIHVNPLLTALEAALANEDPAHDPTAQTIEQDRSHTHTIRAIVQTYADLIATDEAPAAACLHGYDIGWLRALSRQDAK